MKFFLLLTSILVSLQLNAGQILSTTIKEVRSGPYWNELFLFRVDNPNYSHEECHTADTVLGKNGFLAVNASLPGADMWISTILSAHASQNEVDVWTNGGCVSASGVYVEELSTIAVK